MNPRTPLTSGRGRGPRRGRGNHRHIYRSSPMAQPLETQSIVYQPTSETVFTRSYSTELVKMAVTATISDIIYRRGVFPNLQWDHRTFDPADPTSCDYDAFKKGSQSKEPVGFEPSDQVLYFKILPRGKHDAVDKILDWLEIGVKDALEKEFISKLELAFHSDDGEQVSDANLVEHYAMSFKYGHGGGVTTIRTLNRTQEVTSVTVRDARQDALKLMEGVLQQVNKAAKKDLQPLPSRLRVTMYIEFNDKCDKDYQPKFFGPRENPSTRTAGTGPAPLNLTMTNNFHSVSFHLLGAPNEPNIKISPVQSNNAEQENLRAYASLDENTSRTFSPESRTSLNTHSQGENTQQQVMNKLRKMGEPRYPDADTQDTLILQTAPNHLREKSSANKALNRYEANARPQRSSDYKAAETPVQCECDVVSDESNLMRCNVCGYSQHMQCYGYYEASTPDFERVCYSCLLQNKAAALSDMKEVCRHRRLLYHMREQGDQSVGELCRILGCDTDTIVNMLGKLKEYVQGPQKPTGKRGLQHLAQSKYALVGNEQKMRKKYFNPDHYITDHVLNDTPTPTPSFGAGPSQNPSNERSLLRGGKSMQRAVSFSDSTTQGTPSPAFDKRHTRSQPGDAAAASPVLLHTSAIADATSGVGRKRGAVTALGDNPTKRFSLRHPRS